MIQIWLLPLSPDCTLIAVLWVVTQVGHMLTTSGVCWLYVICHMSVVSFFRTTPWLCWLYILCHMSAVSFSGQYQGVVTLCWLYVGHMLRSSASRYCTFTTVLFTRWTFYMTLHLAHVLIQSHFEVFRYCGVRCPAQGRYGPVRFQPWLLKWVWLSIKCLFCLSGLLYCCLTSSRKTAWLWSLHWLRLCVDHMLSLFVFLDYKYVVCFLL